MILLREFKEHKKVSDLQLPTSTSNTYPQFIGPQNINLDKMRLFLLWCVVVERELSGQKR